MPQEQCPVVVTPALRRLFADSWPRCHILYFGAPCGFGKNTTAKALLHGHKVCEYNAETPNFWQETPPENCDTVLVDKLQALNDPADQQAVCAWMNKNPTLHFVFLSRGVLPGWLLPYQFTGLLVSIEPKDLLFDATTTAKLLAQSGIAPTPEELAAIQRESIGYPLALAILCRRMAGGVAYSKEVADEVRRELFYYYEEAVYRPFTPPLRRLLVNLCPFDTFTLEQARMVSGESHINDLLAQLLHETTMLQCDSVNTYHFWPVFRAFLLWELPQACTPEQQRSVYSRAGLYYELRDEYDRAMACYTKSGEHDKISQLLIKNAELHPGVAHYYEMEPYYNALPKEDILRSPALLCGMSMLAALTLDYEGSEQWYAELQSFAARLHKTDADYKDAKAKLLYLDIALPQRGSTGLAQLIGTVFKAVTDKNLKLPAFSVTSTLPSVMNGGKDFCGWSKTDDLLYAAMKHPLEAVLGKDGVGLADCALCESKFEKGEDVSYQMLDLVARMGEIQRKGTPDIEFAVLGLLARTQIMQGKADAALQTLDALRTRFVENGQTRFLPNLDALRCRIWLRTGQKEETARWLREDAPSSVPTFRALWRYRYITKAMVQIANGAPDEALLTTAPLLPYCEQCGRTMDTLYLRLILAICHYRQKDAAWKAELTTALDTAYEYGFITPVAQFGAAVLPLMQQTNAKGFAWQTDPAYYEKLLLAVREQAVNYSGFLRPETEQLPEPLSPMETQVLKLVCAHRSNQEIADMMGTKLATVKTQVHNILRKLGLTRRSEVRDAAERLNLL